MIEAPTTWALVVGIDLYDAFPPLKSPVLDAIQFVQWLRDLGVPTAQILCHAPPLSPNRSKLAELVESVRPATRPNIDESVAMLKSVDAAARTRLFVYVSGHGFWIDKADGESS